jgi:hypothetical protein
MRGRFTGPPPARGGRGGGVGGGSSEVGESGGVGLGFL